MIQLLSSAESCFKNRSKSNTSTIANNPWTHLSVMNEVVMHLLAYRSQTLVSINTSLLSTLTNISYIRVNGKNMLLGTIACDTGALFFSIITPE